MNEFKDKKPFYQVLDTTGRLSFWIPKKNHSKRVICVAGFDLNRHLPLVDQIDQLDYVCVDRVTSVDSDMSYIAINQQCPDALSRLAHDLPNILCNYENAQKTNQLKIPTQEKRVSH